MIHLLEINTVFVWLAKFTWQTVGLLLVVSALWIIVRYLVKRHIYTWKAVGIVLLVIALLIVAGYLVKTYL